MPRKSPPRKKRRVGKNDSNDAEDEALGISDEEDSDMSICVEMAEASAPETGEPPPPHNSDGEEPTDEEGDDQVREDVAGGIRYNDIYIPPPPPRQCAELGQDGTRLIIKYIECTNFKSYRGRHVVGPFNKCFNSIVGPNGSGKSNVIDSMLFVFGYRASKIRSKKLSVLIHNSDRAGDINHCTVSVHFAQIADKETPGCDIIPNSDFVISRTVFKDNSSYYCVNGKKATFKQVATMLRKYGIDLDHNRFLILQGEVEQIAMMKPKGLGENETGMLEFIEDIVGTSRYKEPIDKLYGICDQLSDERTEKMNRLKIVEKEREALEKPLNEAIQYLEAENDVTLKRNILLQKLIYEGGKNVKMGEEKKKNLKEQIKTLSQSVKAIEDKEAAMKKELQDKEKEHSTITAHYEKLKEQFNAISARDAGIQAEVVQLSKNRKKMKDQLAQERKKLADLELIPEKNAKEIEEINKLEQKLLGEKTKAEEERDKIMAGLRTETQGLQDKKEQLENKLLGLQKETNTTKDQFDMAQAALDLYLSTEQKEKLKLEQLTASLSSATATLKERQTEQAKIKAELPGKETALQTAKAQVENVRREEAAKSLELRELRSTVEENRIAMQATKSQSRVLSFLMQESHKGRLQGVVGRLGDLGAIDAKYDVAVSTAVGALDNIVVETVDCAQNCIKLLKEHDVGRGTFIALEKIENLRSLAEGRISPPEGVPRLYDLIKVREDRLKTAFYYAARDTLVANDLNQATRIAYGKHRYRVVTLEGQMIEISGTMAGGGRRQLRGRMGQRVVNTVSPKEQETMQKNYEKLQKEVLQLRQELSVLEMKIPQLEQELPAMRMKLNKGNIEIQSLQEQLPIIKEQMARQTEKVKEAKPDPKQVKKLTDERDKAQAVYTKAAEAASEIERGVKDLHNKIMALTKGKVSTAQKKLDDITNRINKIRQERTKLGVGIKTAGRNTKSSKEKITNLETEISDIEANIIKLQEEKVQVEKSGAVCLEEMNSYMAKVTDAEAEVAELKAKTISEDKTSLRAKMLDLEQKLEECNKGIQEYNASIAANKKKIASLKLRDIPGKPLPELRTFSVEEMDAIDFDKFQWELSVLEKSLTEKKPNLGVLKEWELKTELFIQRTKELDEITQQRNTARAALEQVRQKRLTEFLDGYSIITHKLKEMYQMLTLGGDAELELVDSLDPFSEGIVFSVRPPKKSWKNISNLSGGEKTLSSLALVFALHYYKPSPLFVMDEIDAALDFKNVSIVANYIKERTRNAQFIIISLRSNMFELADHLIGIYKTLDCTHTVAVNPAYYTNLLPRMMSGGRDKNEPAPSSGRASTETQENSVLVQV